jgi:membrane associated rhomboid family serine protease
MTSQSPNQADSRKAGLVAVVVLLGVMWVAEAVDVLLGGRLDRLGVEPRQVDGLTGVVLAPFLHGGFGHLIANTVPFLVLGALVALSGLARLLLVTAIVTVVSGLGTWLVAPGNTLHIGASGVVFGFAAYLVARGVFDRRLHYIATGVIVALLYGTTLLLGLVPRPGVSWQGHLFGAVGGLLAARLLAQRPRRAADRR